MKRLLSIAWKVAVAAILVGVIVGVYLNYRNRVNWQLLDAARRGEIEDVKQLLARGANANSRVSSKASRSIRHTPITEAARAGHLEVVKLLKENGADIGVRGNRGMTPMRWAAEGGHLDIMKYLKEQGADLEDENLMITTARGGHVEAMKWLHEQGVPITGNEFRTPMQEAAQGGHLEAVQWLAAQGADVNEKDSNGWTLMHYAATGAANAGGWNTKGAHLDVMKWLAEQGVGVDSKNNNAETPMHRAARGGHLTIMKWLKDQGADVDAEDNEGKTPITIATGIHPFVEHWLKGKTVYIDANTENDRLSSAMYWAASGGHVEMMQWLRQLGASVNSRKVNGWTPMHNSSSRGAYRRYGMAEESRGECHRQ